ncbi:9035_t:CDS:2, partial [Gigaspora margarita]
KFEKVISDDEPNIDEVEISSDDESSDDDIDIHQPSTHKHQLRSITDHQNLPSNSNETIITKVKEFIYNSFWHY